MEKIGSVRSFYRAKDDLRCSCLKDSYIIKNQKMIVRDINFKNDLYMDY